MINCSHNNRTVSLRLKHSASYSLQHVLGVKSKSGATRLALAILRCWLVVFLRVYPLDARTAVAERSDDTQLCVIRGTWLTVVGEGKDEALRDWFGIQ
ncbi:hypothetical protein CEXT_53261 [Caerostris extrusa]|uniref:Uncharacterized protein n=1 Tax=Caerostris extrusa TaxID=172846 RepID=A0AAV4XE08_CAEEX|nr:hypothetical protein CEXT_53261 [Caerostris extrusa]